jgi:hypothetical protein
VRRAEELSLQVVGPAVQGADDVFCIAPAAEHDRLPVAADVRQELDSCGVSLAVPYEHPGGVSPRQRVIVPGQGDHKLMAYIVRPSVEQELLFEGEDLGVEIPRHRELRARGTYLSPSRKVRHSL